MKLLLISNSTNYKEPYLGWCQPLIEEFLQGTANNIAFVPYAGVDVAGKVYPESYDAYTDRVQKVFDKFGKKIRGVAKCDTKDTFNEETGKRIAFLRATNKRKREYINGYLRPILHSFDKRISRLITKQNRYKRSIEEQLKIIAKNCEEISNI